MPTNDLNKLSVPVSATGDYGLNLPKNAWPGAGDDVVVSMREIGDYLYQTGYDADGDGESIYMRRRPTDGTADWGEWSKFPPDPAPEPPEPPQEPPEQEPET